MSDATRNPDQSSESPQRTNITPLPKLQLSVILYVQLAEPITGTVILPFIAQLVQETGITGGDVNKVAYYAGLVESLFFFTQSLTILQIGRLSDRIGRRPVILIGLAGLGLSMLSFGLARTFWMVVASRAVAGVLNGNSGVLKCVVSEISDDTNLIRALSFMPIMWSTGSTLGPLIGGTLQHPYERFGGIFRLSEFWRTNPYFLPCIISTLYSFSAFLLSYFFLEETAPSVAKDKYYLPATTKSKGVHTNGESSRKPVDVDERSPLLSQGREAQNIPLLALLTPRVRLVILNYSLLALVDIAFVMFRPIFMSLPISNGGLGMSPSQIGIYLSCSGVLNGLVSVLLLARLHRRFGPRAVVSCCQIAHIASFILFPVTNALARVHGGFSVSVWTALVLQLAFNCLPGMAYSGIFIFLASAAPSRSALGATTGLAQTTTSLMRAVGPACATYLFSLSMERNLLGGLFFYLVFCLISVLSITASTFLPQKAWTRED